MRVSPGALALGIALVAGCTGSAALDTGAHGVDPGLDAGAGSDVAEAPDLPEGHDTDVAPFDPDPTPTIAWRRCPFSTGGGGQDVECADVALPLDWGAVDGPQLDVFLKRVPAQGEPRASVWLLSGGPGGAGDAMEEVARLLGERDEGLEFYLPDHRGAGRSGRLSCPAQERSTGPGSSEITDEEWPACLDRLSEDHGAGLGQFTATAAAMDLGALIAATSQRRGLPVIVLGLSYGTWWAHRHAQLFPEQPAALVLDSICLPGLCDLTTYDEGFDETGRALLARCADDPRCRGRFEDEPEATLARALDGLDAGLCPGAVALGLDRRTARRVLAALLTDWELRALIPAIALRLDRCSEADVAALSQLARVFGLGRPPFSEPSLFSPVLNHHIGLSEMWADPSPSPEELARRSHEALISPDATLDLIALRERWPRYAPDALAGAWASVQVPMLMLNGNLDPQTPLSIAAPAAEAFSAPGQTFIEIDGGGHAAIFQAPTEGGGSCGLELISAFLREPGAPLDRGCLGRLRALDFDGDPRAARWMLGSSDPWGGGQEKSAVDLTRPAGLWRVLAAFRTLGGR